MLYRIAADLLLLAHGVFVLFVVFGGLLVLRSRHWAWLHLPAALWGAAIELGGWICPLTPWENELRRLGGESGYSGGFVERYVFSWIYPAGLTRAHQIVLGVVVLALNLAIYLWLWRRLARPADGRG